MSADLSNIAESADEPVSPAPQDEYDESADVVPDAVRSFVLSLVRHLRTRNTYQLHTLYDSDFPKISDRYFADTTWPSPESIAVILKAEQSDDFDRRADSDGAAVYNETLIVYKELYFRHIYAVMEPTVDDRVDSYQTFIDLFNALLQLTPQASGASAPLELPTVWTWDIVDQFIDQYQSFHLFRHKTNALSEDDIAVLHEQQNVWATQTVIRYLHALIRKANIDIHAPLSASATTTAASSSASSQSSAFYTQLGHFALFSLLRLHTLLCNYDTALHSLDPLDLRRHRPLFMTAVHCHMSVYYHLAFAYFMLRRYSDAAKTCAYFLTHMQRNKHLLTKHGGPEGALGKRIDAMYGILLMCHALTGESLDESFLNDIREKYELIGSRIARYDLAAYEETFNLVAPKFINVTAPNYNVMAANTNAVAALRQHEWMLLSTDISQRLSLPPLIQTLQLFSSISLSKMTRFLKMTDDDKLTAMLVLTKQLSRQYRWHEGPLSSGRWVDCGIGMAVNTDSNNNATNNAPSSATGSFVSAFVDFSIDRDSITVHQPKTQRRYAEFFIRQFARLDEINAEIKQIRR